ncbi:MAG: lysophospholipid acyltransferase family protein [Halioglobus sp.]
MIKQTIARRVLELAGWKIEGDPPTQRRFVLIAAPHTSNWDFPLMLLFATAFGLKVKWLAKDSLFWPPMGWLMRWMGGIPVVRGRKLNQVDAMRRTFANGKDLVLVVPTEGTRSRTDRWRSGFYHIARESQVPIVPSYLDYGKKRGGFGPPVTPSEDLTADMDIFRNFYAPMNGKFPELFGPIRLAEEGTDDSKQS